MSHLQLVSHHFVADMRIGALHGNLELMRLWGSVSAFWYPGPAKNLHKITVAILAAIRNVLSVRSTVFDSTVVHHAFIFRGM